MLDGDLDLPPDAPGVVIFVHGSGSSRHSPRNKFVASMIRAPGLGTLLFDLLTVEEEAVDEITKELRFDISLLSGRLISVTQWIMSLPRTKPLRVGYFGASTGGGAALVAAAHLGDKIGAIVSRGGRPDLAGSALQKVRSPTLLIVGAGDEVVLHLNQQALARMRCERELRVIAGATHLFQEPGKLEEVARISADWFQRHLASHSEEEII
ncbi:MAG: dienelactone hydrolase family protein [Verrucomicrobiaceae bacterium]|jgi:putative phosphoribosyl transferase|nr:dienelactone hydrolase family protein [Verrucomicrobiaceae bacterium]